MSPTWKLYKWNFHERGELITKKENRTGSAVGQIKWNRTGLCKANTLLVIKVPLLYCGSELSYSNLPTGYRVPCMLLQKDHGAHHPMSVVNRKKVRQEPRSEGYVRKKSSPWNGLA